MEVRYDEEDRDKNDFYKEDKTIFNWIWKESVFTFRMPDFLGLRLLEVRISIVLSCGWRGLKSLNLTQTVNAIRGVLFD